MNTDHFDVAFTYLNTGDLDGLAYQKKWGHIFDV